MLSTIIFIVIIIIAAIILFKIFHSIMKAIITVLLIVLVFGIIFGFFVVKDANNFSKTFKNNYSTYVLAQNGTVYTGFEAKGFNFDSYQEKSLEQLKATLENKSYPGKIIKVSVNALDFSLPQNSNVSAEELLYSDNASLRSLSFKYALFNTIRKEGPLFLLKHLRDHTIEILPDTIIIKTINFTPKPLFAKAKEKISSEKAKLSSIIPLNISHKTNTTNTNMTNTSAGEV